MNLADIQATVRSQVAEKTKPLVQEAIRHKARAKKAERRATHAEAIARAAITDYEKRLEAKADEAVNLARRVQDLDVQLAQANKTIATMKWKIERTTA